MSQNVYTTVASSSLLQTELLASRLAKFPVGGSKRVLQVAELSGPSTNAGAVARQSLMLAGGGEQPVCGWVDFAAGASELRDYETTKAGYESRYRKTFDVTEPDYRAWLHRLQAVFKELEVRCTISGGDAVSYGATDTTPAHIPQAEISPQPGGNSVAIALLLGLLFAAVVVIFFLMRR